MKPWFEKELVTELKEPVQYKGFDISVSKTKVKPPYIAVITSQATHKELSRTGGDTEEEALDSAKQAIDKREADAPNISAGGSTSVLMNTASNDELLKDPSMYNHIYAKISNDKNGPTLVIGQGEEDGFVRSYDRRRKSDSEEVLPQVMFNAKNEFLSQAGIKMNGRYSLDLNGKYEDENKHTVYPLQFQGSTVHSGDKLRMGKPGLTIGATREDIQPWFERELAEADIIKFPEPEEKVIKMPSVAEYPDFISGVQDLQARRKQGQISQDTYDKLYTELIHRFMKKESFETPWFLREAAPIGLPRGKDSLPTYIANVNKLLKTNHSFPVVGSNRQKIGILKPNPGQQIKGPNDVILGTMNGKPTNNVKVRNLEKSAQIKGDERKSWNLGYVTEGLFAIALWLGLTKNQKIIGEHISNEAIKLKTNGQEVPGKNLKTGDNISVRINLPDNNWLGLISRETYQNKDIQGQLGSLAFYINNSKDFATIDNALRTNKKVDKVQVIADGVSAQKASTVDVKIIYSDGTETEFKRSVKSGNVRQFGQGSTGGAIDLKKRKAPDWKHMKDAPTDKDSQADPSRGSREDRWKYVEQFWNNFGIDVRGLSMKDIKKLNKNGTDPADVTGEVEQMFIDDPDLIEAYDHVYQEAAKVIDAGLHGDKEERLMVKKLFAAAKKYAGAKIVHFYAKGYRVMDFRKLDKWIKKVDLKAEFIREKKKGEVRARPQVRITNEKGIELMNIELEIQKSKATNAVNMGPLIKEFTTMPGDHKDIS